ncbi:MAG: hypothetical protein ACK5LN_10625 [Propioniciclava sp.]
MTSLPLADLTVRLALQGALLMTAVLALGLISQSLLGTSLISEENHDA